MNLPFQIEHAVGEIFSQLSTALSSLPNEEYKKPLDVLSNSSIGQHTRHIIEFFKVLIEQYDDGCINYDKRERDLRLETDVESALGAIADIQNMILLQDKEVTLSGVYAGYPGEITVTSSYHRELVYNLEHAVHHMAMIKVGFRQLTNSALPLDFGVAASTMVYKKSIP
jgi:uncharacterized damage-inducible protein DinB